MPDWMASTVLVPMTAGGATSAISGSWAPWVNSALAEVCTPAAEAAVAIDDLDVRGRSEVDHHHRRPVKRPSRHRIGHPVGADLAGVGIVGVEEPGGRLGVAHQRERAGGILDRLHPRTGQLGHHRGDRRGAHLAQVKFLEGEQRGEDDAQLVGRRLPIGGDSPHRAQRIPSVHPNYGMGVTDVNGK